jgi:hypothetical protein
MTGRTTNEQLAKVTAFYDSLEDVPKTRWLFPRRDGLEPIDIRKAWENARGAAKLEDFRFHDLRHSTARHFSHRAIDGQHKHWRGGNPKQLRGARLGEAAFTDDLINPGDKFGLQKMRLCIRPTEVGEDIPGPGLDTNIVLLAHRLEPFPYVFW